MHRNDVHHASPGRPHLPPPPRAHIHIPSPAVPQLWRHTDSNPNEICQAAALPQHPSPSHPSFPHPPPRGASLPLWLYKLSPCAGCASHANQISVGLIKNRSRDFQASQHCAQLSSDESSQSHNKLQPHSTFVCSEFNFVLSCCRRVWLLHVVWRCGAATAAARMCVCVCWGGCARVGSKPLWHNC